MMKSPKAGEDPRHPERNRRKKAEETEAPEGERRNQRTPQGGARQPRGSAKRKNPKGYTNEKEKEKGEEGG